MKVFTFYILHFIKMEKSVVNQSEIIWMSLPDEMPPRWFFVFATQLVPSGIFHKLAVYLKLFYSKWDTVRSINLSLSPSPFPVHLHSRWRKSSLREKDGGSGPGDARASFSHCLNPQYLYHPSLQQQRIHWKWKVISHRHLKEIAEDSSISCSSCGAQTLTVAIKGLNRKEKN